MIYRFLFVILYIIEGRKMKKIAYLTALLAILTNFSFAQYIDVPQETKSQLKSGNLILGFINPKDFSMESFVNMSYGSVGNANVSLASYTARLNYNVLKNMKLSADVTMQYSPYASIGSTAAINKQFQSSFNGVNLSRLSLDYQPFKDMYISLNYFNPGNNYYNPYGAFGGSYYNRSPFGFGY